MVQMMSDIILPSANMFNRFILILLLLLCSDALLLDLESSTLHVSKFPVFLSDQSRPLLPAASDQRPLRSESPERRPEVNGGVVTQSPDSDTSPNGQSDPLLSPNSQSEPVPPDEHIYSFPLKPRPPDLPVVMATLGSNLSELDRLLLELNTVDHSTAFVTQEETAPPLPSTSILLQEHGPEKPKRGGARRGEEKNGGGEDRPSVESLLDELENSVPTPSPGPLVVTEDPADPSPDPSSLELSSLQTSRMSASSATRELDELMASLSDFKVQSNVQQAAPVSPPNKLDNMLGSLQSDLNRLGVQTGTKGVCGACKKPIAGQVVTAMGRTWHPEHFVCSHCQEEIGSRNFFERDGAPYCEKDYHHLFSPRCHYCNGPILDKVVTALDKTWHPEHFFCAQCGEFFGPEGFHEREGKAFCRKDYFQMFAPKCGGCSRAILENYISALNALWHPECFVCRECFTPFVNGSFFDHDGLPFCESHYHERRGSLCSGCQRPITGRCITAMSRKFHPEHFVCAFCLKQLNKGTFKEQQDKPYCHTCFSKLFS
ncbi:paxillin-like [Boleophthalmus pectinirostris]|uniref:paxillin-like n=1 Tax=Boleophthalmus pectinirostris TaxID=150288 RepID=UPI00242CA89B|nr:paxillin-like [Boleophthalmus pectinirostris]